jgi:hypothetical protein
VNSTALHLGLGLLLLTGLSSTARAQNQVLSGNLSPTGGYIEVPATPNLAPSNFTIEAWIKYTDTGLPTGWNYPTIARKEFTQGSASWFLRVDAGNIGSRILRLWINGNLGVVHLTWAFPAGTFTNWTHVAATYDGLFATLYINGAQVAQVTGKGPLTDIGGATHIGAGDTAPGSANERWNGWIDELRIWSVARTPQEIQSAMLLQILTAPNLNASYQLTGNGIDATGNGNNGNLIASPVFVTTPSPATGTAPTAYCTAGTSSHGCLASIAADHNPSVAQSNACNIAISNVEGLKFGIIFYGADQMTFTPTPWAAGSTSFLCVKGPTQRTGTGSSGGTVNACDGALLLDWNAYQTAHPAAVGNPWLVGDKVFVQGWYRDPPAAKTTNLSNALEMTYVP